MPAIGAWIRRQGHIYLDNAASKRDFRVQLRGSKAILLWSVYLLVFALVAGFAYSSIASSDVGQKISLASAQQQLHSFYQVVLTLLAGMLTLIAPALGASAIVTERQRRSLDLVFSAPVTAKYYLVGKLLSSYRYIWMLMILSLPIVSVGAVMGGETWADVFKSFLIISLDSLLFSAIALAISAGANKLPAALTYSYIATILILIFASASGAITAAVSMFGRGGKTDMPVIGLLSPFTLVYTGPTTTTIFDKTIPNWLLLIPCVLLLVALALLGGGSALSTRHVKETTWFRALGLVFVAVTGFCFMSFENTRGIGAPSSTLVATASGTLFATGLLPFLALVPFLTCFVRDDPLKFSYDGGSKIQNMFRAKPSGALYFALAVPLSGFLGAAVRLTADGSFQHVPGVLSYLLWITGLFVVTWGMGRLTSRVADTLTAARALSFVLLAFFLAVPAIIVNVTAAATDDTTYTRFSPWSVLGGSDKPTLAATWGVVLFVAGILLNLWSNRVRKKVWNVI